MDVSPPPEDRLRVPEAPLGYYSSSLSIPQINSPSGESYGSFSDFVDTYTSYDLNRSRKGESSSTYQAYVPSLLLDRPTTPQPSPFITFPHRPTTPQLAPFIPSPQYLFNLTNCPCGGCPGNRHTCAEVSRLHTKIEDLTAQLRTLKQNLEIQEDDVDESSSSSQPRRHERIANGYECVECEKTFSLYRDLKRHLKVHGPRTFICRYLRCDAAFTFSKDLDRHIATKHEKRKKLKCTKCELSFGRQDNLRRHMNIVHGQANADLQEPG